MNAQDAMRKWREENASRVRKKEKINRNLLADYYDLADALGFKVDKEFIQSISAEAFAEVVEVLKEKVNDAR